MSNNIIGGKSMDDVFHAVMKEDYSEMLRDIGVQKFRERFLELNNTAKKFLSDSGYASHVECNQRILLTVLLDYWSDIYRMKDFHLIERARTEKIFSYLIAWIIKRKPLQFVRYAENEKDIFVNERFCAYLLLNECLMSGKKRIAIQHVDKLDEYVNLLLYYFKYRVCNPQAIELLIKSFEMGTYTNVADEG